MASRHQDRIGVGPSAGQQQQQSCRWPRRHSAGRAAAGRVMCGRKQRAATAINGPGQDEREVELRLEPGSLHFSYYIIDIATDLTRLFSTKYVLIKVAINYQSDYH